ncbi:MAG: hypothetical protein P8H59_07760 [Flavobacteriales bacterium]|nr:hypothetical protein [Flavobacteriales bacterium]
MSCSSGPTNEERALASNAPHISTDQQEQVDEKVEANEAKKASTPPKRHRVRMGDIPGEVQGFYNGTNLERIEGELITEQGKEFDVYVYEAEKLIYSTHYQHFDSFAGKEGAFAIQQKLYYNNDVISQVETRTGKPQNQSLDHLEYALSYPDMDAVAEMYSARLAAYARALGQGRAQ